MSSETAPTTTEATTAKPESKQKGPTKEEKKAQRLAARQQAAKAEASTLTALSPLTLDEYVLGSKQFGPAPLVQSDSRAPQRVFVPVQQLDKSKIGQSVWMRGRLWNARPQGNKMTFCEFRLDFFSVQLLVAENPSLGVSREMVKYAAKVSLQSIVQVEGTIAAPYEPVKSCTQQDVEVHVTRFYVISEATPALPLNPTDAEKPDTTDDEVVTGRPRVNQDIRLDNRVLDLRVPAHVAIFRVQSAVGQLFREFLYTKNFMEIHTPKLISTASEGGANVFKVDYFGDKAFLAQSPQLYKQMAIESDFDRVFEVGPVFRAEDSNTPRHLTEFVGLDIEMQIQNSYHEVLDILDEMFVFIFENLEKRYARELAIIRQRFPSEPLKYDLAGKNLRLHFSEGIRMLQEAGFEDASEDKDLSTPQEKKLGELVKQKYGTEFYVLHKYPVSARPFYTMPCPENPRFTNSYDLFIRGEEICSGAQRIHDPQLLQQVAAAKNVSLKPILAYVDAFRYGAWPHAGAGIGLERVVMLYLNLGNIRRSSLFPRDPKRLNP